MDTKRGLFIVLEGGEGVGKTTLAKMLEEELSAAGIETFYTREPGGSGLGEAIRKLLLESSEELTVVEQMCAFHIARSVHLRQTVIPMLNRGINVICDRYTLSTLVYQGDDYNQLLAAFPLPLKADLNFLINTSPETAKNRVIGRGLVNKYDQKWINKLAELMSRYTEAATASDEDWIEINNNGHRQITVETMFAITENKVLSNLTK